MSAISSLTQSDDGLIWLGTEGSEIYSFDGAEFKAVRPKKGEIYHHCVNSVYKDTRLYFASLYSGYFFHDSKKNSTYKFEPKKKLKGEKYIFRKIGDSYLVASQCGLQLQTKAGKVLSRQFSDCDLRIYQIIEAEEAIFLLTSNGNYRIEEGQIIALDNWLGKKNQRLNNFQFGFYDDGKLTLLNSKGSLRAEIVLNKNGSFYSYQMKEMTSILQSDDQFVAFNYNPHAEIGAAITTKGLLYRFEGKQFHIIVNNYHEPIIDGEQVLVDFNGDIWIGSGTRGLYKVSREGFTKVKLIDLYASQDIALPYQFENRVSLISRFNNETTIISPHGEQQKTYDFRINHIERIGNRYYLATNRGIKIFTHDNFAIQDFALDNKIVNLIVAFHNKIYIGISGEGIFEFDPSNKTLSKLGTKDKSRPADYYYTAQISKDNRTIYFGTNDGIYQLNALENKVACLSLNYKELGSYSGVSTRDKFGRCWFTLDRGIVGILNEEIEVHSIERYCKSNLFYTLESDQYGNLFVGTNKGVTRLKLNTDGKIIGHSRYTEDYGFEGYETHMRSQFKNPAGIWMGTVEGLYLIDPTLLEKLPAPHQPFITQLTKESDGNDYSFYFKLNNPKNSFVTFSYRLLGSSKKWISLENNNRIDLIDLSNGDYTLEVRASYDGVHYSDAAKMEFDVHVPIWQTSWFIVLLILLVVGLNVLLLRYNQAFDTSRLIDTKDTAVHLKMAPGIILFGTVSVTGSQLLGPMIDPELTLHLAPTLFVGFTLLSLFILSLSIKRAENIKYNNYLLLAGLIIVQFDFFLELYLSKLHPFHLIAIVLLSMVAPYILGKIRSTVIYSVFTLGSALICAVIIDNPIYSKTYFLIAIFVMSALLIFISYLRYNSLEKLMFISGIINKGNLPAISFDSLGIINYVSENISEFANIDHTNLLKKHVSYLNKFIPFDGQYKEMDVLKEFSDNKKYVAPMINAHNQIIWTEWSFNKFSDDVNVMIGQNVSERIELENTYELLVQNAEDFIYRCDVDGMFIFMNDACYEKLGYTKAEILNQPALFIVDNLYKEEVQRYYDDHFKSRATTSYREFPIRTKEGALIWIGQHVTTIFATGSHSYIRGFIALARDITEVKMQQEIILDQRDSITSSIHYARRIQQNLLPHEREFTNVFKSHFVLYKPKDIVSGDFYFLEDLGDSIILALADCTGHGVPGSFMTLLGLNLMNTIIHEDQLRLPGEILDKLDSRLMEILPRGENESQVSDGMEITVCSIDKKSKEMSFACAGSRFLVYHENSFTMYKGDTKHIGDINYDGFQNFTTNYTSFTPDDQLFLFTDGFQDQFGGPNDKKFSFRRMLDLFENCVDLKLSEQKEEILEEYERWIGEGQQTDDLSLVCVRRNVV